MSASHCIEAFHLDGREAILGESSVIWSVRQLISTYADSNLPVLLEGESGSGKELAARALHRLSGRRGQLLPVNCSAIPSALVESLLFGHRKGAFTGAHGMSRGLFESAEGGTLFLDEVGELPLEAQSKLLRVLEDGEFCRLGETSPRISRARVIAATNRNLRHEVRAGRFRADLYHRLNVYAVRMPALRELGTDLDLLIDAFRRRCASQSGTQPFKLEASARKLLDDYPFPGNVRELRNIVLRLQARFPGRQVDAAELRAELDLGAVRPEAGLALDLPPAVLAADGFSLNDELRRQERRCIDAALQKAHGNISAAARLLGLQRSTLCSRLQSLRLRTSD
jgi:two-component system nitrogen regulation response regulator GlnG